MSTEHTSRHPVFPRLALMAGAAALLAACSSDVERLSEYPPVKTTASLPGKAATSRTAPVGRVATRRLDGPATPSWERTRRAAPVRTASVTSGYVTVRPGQTLYSIARANGKSVAEVAAANNLSAPYSVRVGQRLRIPGVASPASPAPTFRPASAAAIPARGEPTERNYGAARPGTHRVAAGETLFSLGRKYHLNPYRIAAYNGLPRNVRLKAGQIVRIPGASSAPEAAAAPVAKPHSAPKKDNGRIPAAPSASAETAPAPAAPSTPAAAAFLWPVRGKVISTYGAKPGGTRNEGINIAVSEGADIHAAGDGVVAYAGNELKGYGNLVLIRHKGGWVTAYAHNKELFVRRGDRVRRGQVIAKAGSTGSVKTPQLHFELRKGAAAVNPLNYLGTATAMN